MAAGTTEPTQTETSSPQSATVGALSRGDIQPEPRVAESSGWGTIILIYLPSFIVLLNMQADASTQATRRNKSSEMHMVFFLSQAV